MKAFQVSIPPCRRCVFQLGILYQAHGSRVLFDYSAVHTVSVPVACVPLCVSPLYKTMFLHAEKEEKHCVYKHAFFCGSSRLLYRSAGFLHCSPVIQLVLTPTQTVQFVAAVQLFN